MPNIFVVSDTWFNRLLDDDPNENIIDNNENIIRCWNETVGRDDEVYVLGGFGIGDLYQILVRLNGKIHFLDNFFNDDEKSSIDVMKDCLEKSSDQEFKTRITFEGKQIVVLKEQDAVLSYFPLSDWSGKSTGTYCFHGLDTEMSIIDHFISCVSNKWEHKPVNITDVENNIQTFSKELM